MYKIIFSTGRGKKFGQFKTFDLKHFLKVGCPTEEEEEAEGGVEDILGTPVKDAELKVGLNCFALWPANKRFYRATIVERGGKEEAQCSLNSS